MPRKKSELGKSVEAAILEMRTQGKTLAQVTAALQAQGVTVSLATVRRRYQEMRLGFFNNEAPTEGPNGEDDKAIDEAAKKLLESSDKIIALEGDIDEPVPVLKRALRAVQSRADNLPKNGDLRPFLEVTRVIEKLASSITNKTPPTAPDPNESPDMVGLARKVRASLKKDLDTAEKIYAAK